MIKYRYRIYILMVFLTGIWQENLYAAPCNFSVSITKTNVDCFGTASGEAELHIEGPGGVYTCLWSNGDTTTHVENLKASTYFVKVNDSEGCEVIDFVQITEPNALSLASEIQHVTCYGDHSGSVVTEVSGGVAPYTYTWNNGSEINKAEDLYAGSYDVSISDKNYCEITDTFIITQPAQLTDTHIIKNASGYKLSNGAINMNVSGGIKPYQYQWYENGMLIDTVEDVNNLSAGTYSFFLNDANDCVYEKTFVVSQPDTLAAIYLVQNVDCSKGTSGAINMTVTGGVQPYSFVWSNKDVVIDTREDIGNLKKGMYYITITDANGNIYRDSSLVDEPSPMILNLTPADVTCYGGENGRVVTWVSGGEEPYTYQWSNGATSQHATGLTAGLYEVDIVDSNGCAIHGKIEIDQPDPFELKVEHFQITCKDASDGALNIEVSGNTAPYAVQWNTGQTGFSETELEQGRYQLNITDVNQCDTVYETNFMNPANVCIEIPNAFTPNNDGINDTWEILNTELYPKLVIYVYSKTGAMVYKGNISSESWDGNFKGNEVAAGTYYYTLNLNNGDQPFKGTVTIVR